MKILFRSFLVITLVHLFSSWGFLVHRTTNQLAIYQLPKGMQSFFYQNKDYIVKFSVRPDQRRNEDSTEATKHFIDLEMFEGPGKPAMPKTWEPAVEKYSKDSLLKYGYVPYYIVAMKAKLTEAFKKKQKDSILFYATDLAHYIGDANVPLHTSVNYDGQLTNQKGLHSLWESVVPEIEIENYNLYSSHKAKYIKDPAAAAWAAVRRSFALLNDVFGQETELSKQFPDSLKYRVQIRRGKEYKSYTSTFAKAYNAKLAPTINDQLLHSADMIADFWYTCWVDAGCPSLDELQQPMNEQAKTAMEEEKNAYKENQLIKKNLLMAKQNQQGEQ